MWSRSRDEPRVRGGSAQERRRCTLTEPAGAGHFELIDPRTGAWDQVRDIGKFVE